jgi:acetolactate synthase-1/2/3 large subunit
MKASDLFVKCLEAEGVEYIFGLPGEETNDLMISLADSSKIKFVLTRHEQGAAFMADVYGRLIQKVGVCLSTLGPGATNLTTGVASANMDRSPLLAITGQTNTEQLHKESHQNMDPITMFKPITKWRWSMRNADSIPEIIRRAFKIAVEVKSGAVHLELPQDIAQMESNIKPLKAEHALRPRPNKDLIKEVVKMISESKLPIILIGNGCMRKDSSIILRKFVERTGICSVNTFMAKGVISDRSERHLQTIGIKEADYALTAIKKADLVIAIGYDLVEYSPKNWNRTLKKNIIHIDFTPAEVDTYYTPSIEISADIEYTIEALLEDSKRREEKVLKNSSSSDLVSKKAVPDLLQKIKKEVTWRIDRYSKDTAYPIKPEKLIVDVRNALDQDDVVISYVGAHKLWIAKVYNTYSPNTCLITNGFCSMGFALPGAIAAQLVKPKRKVVAMCGDGGFLMNAQEIETAVRLKLPIIVVIWCDGDFGMISLKQSMEFRRTAFTRFTNPDFVKLAESFGALRELKNFKQY